MIQPITIAGRQIGPGHPPWIVAEMSANHGRSFDRAIAIIDAAAEAGADAVKVQAFGPDEMSIDRTAKWGDRSLPQLYTEAAMPYEWLLELSTHAACRGLTFFASVFSPYGVELVENLIDPPCYKIASFELTCEPLLRAVAGTGKPVILSTGMATHKEIALALATLARGAIAEDSARAAERVNSGDINQDQWLVETREAVHAGTPQVALLHCVSAYPAPVKGMGVGEIAGMHKRFGVPVGLSDHSNEEAVVTSAAAVGSAIIEMHLAGPDSPGGLDTAFSRSPFGFQHAVYSIQKAWSAVYGYAVGGIPDGVICKEEEPALALRRSIYATEDIAKGEAFTTDNIACLRPAKGLPPSEYHGLVAKEVAAVTISAGTPLAWAHVLGGDSQCDSHGTHLLKRRHITNGNTALTSSSADVIATP